MKKLLITVLVSGLALTATAQRDSAWTLERCIAHAIDNNIEVRSARLDAETARLGVTEAKDRFLPGLSGYASQNFSFGRGLTSQNVYANRNTSSFSTGAQLQLPIFQGLSAIRRVSYEKTNLAAMLEHVEAAKEDLTLNVITAYLQALYTGELTGVARTKVDISQAELARTQALLDAGRVPELDIYQAQAQLAQDRLSLVNAQSDSINALLSLAQLLNLPGTRGFDIRPLEDEEILIPPVEEVYSRALANNHTLAAGRLDEATAKKNVAVAKTGYIPTLNFNAGIGTNYYNTTGIPNETFASQMRHNFSQSIGFTLSVPLFDAFTTRNNVRRSRAAVLRAQLNIDSATRDLYKAIVTAHTAALSAREQQNAAAAALTATREAFRAMQTKYNAGRANATELEKAKNDYIAAMAETVRTHYEAILRARILAFYAR